MVAWWDMHLWPAWCACMHVERVLFDPCCCHHNCPNCALDHALILSCMQDALKLEQTSASQRASAFSPADAQHRAQVVQLATQAQHLLLESYRRYITYQVCALRSCMLSFRCWHCVCRAEVHSRAMQVAHMPAHASLFTHADCHHLLFPQQWVLLLLLPAAGKMHPGRLVRCTASQLR